MDSEHNDSKALARLECLSKAGDLGGGLYDGNFGTCAVASTREQDDFHRCILNTLQSFDLVSRQVCQGGLVDLDLADGAIASMRNIIQSDHLGRAPGHSEGGGPWSSARPMSRKEWKRHLWQMGETLAGLKSDQENMSHRISFVHFAIDCMNFLRRITEFGG